MRFVDTNVLIYAASTAPAERAKALAALSLLERDDLALSAQVLHEFYVQATRPTKTDRMSHQQAALLVEAFLRYPVHPVDVALVNASLAAKERFQISYWDAAIIEAARKLGCDVLLSEDLSDGQDYDGVTVVNPFSGASAT